MLPESLREAALSLFSICVAAVAMDTVIRDARAARPFRAVCALAASVSALRVLGRILN